MTSETTASIPTLTMNTGATIPQVGYGVWQIENGATGVIAEALEVGYRHIDTAMIYFNEREVGAAIAESGIPREELFVTTKLFNTDQGTESAPAAFERSLDLLALDYVDLYLIHWPMPAVDLYVDSWRVLEHIAQSGRAKAIGVSNFMPDHLQRLFDETGTVPAVNQIELHPEFQQREASSFGKAHGILTEDYSPLANGSILTDARIQSIADAHERSVPQVILRWHTQLGNVVIPKTATRSRMIDNLSIFDFTLTEDEMATVSSFDRGRRIGNDPYVVNGA
jgi:2,5-diketo-D-gluconate reductase A